MPTSPPIEDKPPAFRWEEAWWAQLLAFWVVPGVAWVFTVVAFDLIEDRHPAVVGAIVFHLLAVAVASLGVWFAWRIRLERKWPLWVVSVVLAAVLASVFVPESYPRDVDWFFPGVSGSLYLLSVLFALPFLVLGTGVWAWRRFHDGEGDAVAAFLALTPCLQYIALAAFGIVTAPDRAQQWEAYYRETPALPFIFVVSALAALAVLKRR